MEYLDGLAASHPQLCQTEVIGSSYEGRDIKVIKVWLAPTNLLNSFIPFRSNSGKIEIV